MLSRLSQFLRVIILSIFRKLSNRQFLMIGAVLVGLWAGLTAVILKVSVHYLQIQLLSLGKQYSWVYFVSPTLGIIATLVFVHFFLSSGLTKGTSHVLLSIAKKSSILPRNETYSHVVTSAFTVGLGGSAGLESPIVQTGSAIGSVFASLFPVGYRDRTLLLACGAAAGIATAFNAPIAGVLFALEVLLVDVSISAFIPLLIAGATGALCSKIILADDAVLSFKHVVDFNYHNVPYYGILGIACGLLSVFYIKSFLKIENLFTMFFVSAVPRLVVGGLLLGGLIMIFPALFGEGYLSIKALAISQPDQLFVGSPLYDFFARKEWILGLAVLAVAIVKVFAVSFTLNSGGNGGNFAPSLLVGACLGFAFSYLINLTGWVHQLPTSNFALVAMAGVLTGIFHSPLTAIFLIAEITGGYDLIIPLMIVSALSTSVSRYLNPHSLDEIKLKQVNEKISIDKDTHVLSDLSIKNFIEKDFIAVDIQDSLKKLVEAISHSKRNIFPVTDTQGQLHGIIILDDIREIMFNTAIYESLLVNQLMQKPIATIDITEDMSLVMEKFDKSGAWNIPVLDAGKYVGFISKSSVFSSYRDRLKN